MPVKAYNPTDIRNVVLVGHGGSGKTSLAEAMLYVTGAVSRLGKVADGTSILDFEPEEHKRGGSVATSLAWTDVLGSKVNIIDTPGDANFIYDAYNAMRGADAAVLVVSAPDGVEVGTERFYQEALNLGLPVAVYLNKMDRERADPGQSIKDIKEMLGAKVVPIQMPIGNEHSFRGVVSLFGQVSYIYPMDGSAKYKKEPIPAELAAAAAKEWQRLVEEVASTDEGLMTRYLEGEELSNEEIRAAFQKAMRTGEIVPVIYGAATQGVGALSISELIAWAFPHPLEHEPLSGLHGEDPASRPAKPDEPFTAQVIHTTIDEHSGKVSVIRVLSGTVPADGAVLNASNGHSERLGSLFSLRGKDRDPVGVVVCGDILGVPKLKDTHTGDTLCDPKHPLALPKITYPEPMMSFVIKPHSKGDDDKLKTAIERVMEEDPTLSTTIEELTHHMVIRGMGQAQIEMAIEKMRRKYKVSVDIELPPIPYRETLKKKVMGVEGKHKKQTGGAGQFGVAVLNVIPQERGGGFEFVDETVGGAIPRQYIPSVEKGVRERMKHGFLAGYPIVDVRVELIDGKYHPVDSKDVAFQMAGSKGMKAAFEKGGSALLEPVMDMEIVVPTESMGDVMGDITGRRGRVLGMEPRGRSTVIKAHCPLAELQRYAPDLRALTGGKGSFTMHLGSYEDVPSHLEKKIVDASPFHHKEEEE